MRRIEAWLLDAVPAERLAGVRIAVCGYATVWLIVRWPAFWSAAALPARQLDPVGVLWWLGGPLPVAAVRIALACTLVAGIAATVGWRWRGAGPLFAIGFLVTATARLSWGHVLHTDHLVALHLVLIALGPASDAWSLDARARRVAPDAGPSARYGWVVQVMVLATVITYVLAGIAKLRNGGTDWLDGDVLRNQIAFDNLRKELIGASSSPVGAWFVRGPTWSLALFSIGAVAVELGAVVALPRNVRVRVIWAAVAWAFHVGVAVIMAIGFPYPLTGVAFAPLLPLERLASWRRLIARAGDEPTPTKDAVADSRSVCRDAR